MGNSVTRHYAHALGARLALAAEECGVLRDREAAARGEFAARFTALVPPALVRAAPGLYERPPPCSPASPPAEAPLPVVASPPRSGSGAAASRLLGRSHPHRPPCPLVSQRPRRQFVFGHHPVADRHAEPAR